MGLRVNHNIPSIAALRNLKITDSRQSRNMERLSTGLRINRASDDPAGLIISEVLRGQIGSLEQAVENSTNASNMISTTEAALAEINDLLVGIRESLIFALNAGGTSTEQIAAEQNSVDFAIQAIKRIADVTRFGSLQMLNGTSSFQITGYTTSGLMEVRPLSVQFNPTTTSTSYSVTVYGVASQARGLLASVVAPGTIAASGGPITLRLRGPQGTEEINLASGATNTELAAAVNLLRGNLGIYASGGYMYSETFGADVTISVQKIGGTGAWSQPGFLAAGSVFYDSGVDANATIAGNSASARGNRLQVVSTFFTGTVFLNPATNQDPANPSGGTGTYQFTIANESGLLFQFGPNANSNEQRVIGFPNSVPSNLGEKKMRIGGVWYGGGLPSLQSGGDNDLFTNPGNALRVTDAAINNISESRAYLGAFVAQTVEPNIRSLNVAVENLSASESSIRDLDFAEAVAEMTRNQVIFQSGVSVLAQANLIPQAVLRLLQ